RNPSLFGFVSVAENRVELNPGHVGLCDEGLVTAGAFGRGGLFRRACVGKRVMPEVEEAPSVGGRKSLAIFHRYIHAVKFSVEISAARWLAARAVRKGRIQNPSQFLYDHCSFGKGSCFQIYIEIFSST